MEPNSEAGTLPTQPKTKRKPRPRPEQVVTATRLVDRAKRKGTQVRPGVVTFAGSSKKRNARSGNTVIETSFVAEIPPINLRADTIVVAVADPLLAWFRGTMQSGTTPDGKGEQVRLSQAAAANPKRMGPVRGFDTGEASDNLRRTSPQGTTTKAKLRIMFPPSRNAWIGTEAKRGIFYLSTGGDVEQIIQMTLQRWLDAALGDSLADPETRERTAEEIGGNGA